MSLFLLLIIALILGYFLARSRLSKPIDSAADKVVDTSRDASDKAGGWLRRTFGRKPAPQDEVIDTTAKEPEAEKQPAAKQPSRRKEEGAGESDTPPVA